MKKRDIIKLIEANKTILKNERLISTAYFDKRKYAIPESRLYPDVPELKEQFDILKKELLEAKAKTEESKKRILESNCPHEVRLKHYNFLWNSNECVLCGANVEDDNVTSFKKSKYRM